jgi:hypothetical protein
MVRSLVVAPNPLVGDRRHSTEAKLSNSFELEPLVVRSRLSAFSPLLLAHGVDDFETIGKDDSTGLVIIPGIAIPPFPKTG